MCCYLEEGSSSGGGKPCGKNAKVGKMCKNHHKRMVEGRGMLDAVGQAVVCGVVGGGGGGGGMMMMAGGDDKDPNDDDDLDNDGCEYQRMVRENIARNKAHLAKLGFNDDQETKKTNKRKSAP